MDERPETRWPKYVRRYRLRHGLSQAQLAVALGVSQRTVSRWERGEDSPSVTQQKRLRDLGWEPASTLLASLASSIFYCPVPRALTRGTDLTLQALSAPAIAKRPSIANWIGRDLRPLACGVLEEILDDAPLQRAIAKREVHTLVTTTRSVLRTDEHEKIGLFSTTITYFTHEGSIFHDAIGVPAADDCACGYRAITMDEMPFAR